MYQELFQKFENVESLAGKAWQHSVKIAILLITIDIYTKWDEQQHLDFAT